MKPKPFSELNHFTVPCVAMLFVSLAVVIPPNRCQQPAGGTRVQCPFGGVGGSEADSYLTGANRIPGTLPARRERRERRSNRCSRIRAAPWRPKLTSKGYQTDVYAQFTPEGEAMTDRSAFTD